MQPRLLFAADLHLLPGHQPEQNKCLHALLDESIGAGGLYLLGDVFNAWYERGDEYAGDYDEVLHLFERATNAGARIHHIAGNRDSYVGAVLERRSGIACHGEWGRAEYCGQRLLLTHGDCFCRRDHGFQFLRWLLNNWLTRRLVGLAPFSFVAQRVMAVQARPKVFLHGERKWRKDIVDSYVVEAMVKADAQMLFCGHIHQCRDKILTDGDFSGRLIVVPPWGDEQKYAELSADGLAFYSSK